MTIYDELQRSVRAEEPIALTSVIAGSGTGCRMLVRPTGALPSDVDTYLQQVQPGLLTGRIMGGAGVLRGTVGSELSSAVA